MDLIVVLVLGIVSGLQYLLVRDQNYGMAFSALLLGFFYGGD